MGNSFEPTYQLAEGPPAMDWEEYVERAKTVWEELLATDPEEGLVQSFLERHPSFLPGFRSMVITSGHLPRPPGVVTQPRLEGLKRQVPDFMWIAGASGSVFPVLIEIEKPGKRWFKENGDPTAEFNHARTQLATWRNWFRDDVNQRWFTRFYELPDDEVARKVLEPAYVLIYGRRSEFEERPDLNRLRRDLAGADEYHMTFDRLEPNRMAEDLVTCRKRQANGFEIVAVPPTLRWRPGSVHEYLQLVGWEQGVAASEWMTPARRDFLLKRLEYWRDWKKTRQRFSVTRSGDRE